MQELMRKIKKTEKLAALPALAPLYQGHSQAYVMNLVKKGIAALREELRQGRIREEGELDAFVCAYVLKQEASEGKARHQRVLNCTGTVLHTNLGRAVLSPRAGKALEALSHSYSNLELNLETGKRGSRYDHVTDLLCRLTGAEDAIVVNNNAAAGQVVFHAHLHLIPRREGDGLHLWPGRPYADAAAMEAMARAVRQAIASGR